MKHPAFQCYPGDWLKDPALGLCSPATRGIWFDLICAMHEKGDGELSGTAQQLSRLARCSTEEMTAALAELSDTGAADIVRTVPDLSRPCPAHFQVVCRRLKRDAKSRDEWRLRKSRQRLPAPFPEMSPACPAVSSSSTTITTTPKPPPPPKDFGGGGGGENSTGLANPEATAGEKSSPPATIPEIALSAAAWRNLLAAFPALAKRGLRREAVAHAVAGMNGQTAAALAAIALAAADERVRSPLAVFRTRLAEGVAAAAVSQAAAAIGDNSSPKTTIDRRDYCEHCGVRVGRDARPEAGKKYRTPPACPGCKSSLGVIG